MKVGIRILSVKTVMGRDILNHKKDIEVDSLGLTAMVAEAYRPDDRDWHATLSCAGKKV